MRFKAYETAARKVNIWDESTSCWVFSAPVDPSVARSWASRTIQNWVRHRVDLLFEQMEGPDALEAQEAFRRNVAEDQTAK